ncbi:MAG TPA: ATP-binding protein [Gaiellaceae bacterium]|nr:ATP-binding protein [Gaiellaceae bacterium]
MLEPTLEPIRRLVGNRELLTRSVSAAGVVAAALSLLLVAGTDRHPLWWLYPAAVVAYAVASRVEFEAAAGIALPTVVVLIPALFALPARSIPLIALAGTVVAAVVEPLHGDGSVLRAVVIRAGACWYSFGPALVFLAAGEPSADARGALVVLLALVAQIAVDFLAAVVGEWCALELGPRDLLQPFAVVAIIDALLAPIGFLAAVAAERASGWAVLLPVPLFALLVVFARDRKQSLNRVLRLLDEMRDSEERFRQLAGAVPEVFFLFGVEPAETLYVSPAYETVWGRPPDSALASPEAWHEGIHPDDRKRALRELAGGSNRVVESSFRVVRPDGEVRWVVHQLFPVHDQSGEVRRVAGIARDLSEQKTLEDQLRQSQKMEAIGKLAGGVAHDFNNLLTAIAGYAELALLQSDDARVQSHVREISSAADRAAELTKQILAFSRRQVMQPTVVNLNDVAHSTDGLMRRLVGPNIVTRLELDERLGNVLADAGQLGQVLMNLTINARDAMPEGGVLTIKTENVELGAQQARQLYRASPGAYVRLAVTDTGTGMDIETQRRIFEPFFTTKDPGKGTGLGLATCYGIVKQSNGYIEVKSELGRGTTFELFFPRTGETVADGGAPEPERDARHTGASLLVVEDEPVVRELAREILVHEGFEVRAVASPLEAIEVWRAGSFEALVTDLSMPQLSGRELVAQLAEDGEELCVVYMSGYSGDAVGGELMDASHFVQKPFTRAALASVVREALDARAAVA